MSENVSFKFEKLRVWQMAMDQGEELNQIALSFPELERFNLSSQLRRAADSVALNIAEGSILQTDKEQSRFLGYAIRSTAEVVTCLHKARRRHYIDEGAFQKQYKSAFNLMNMTVALRNRLNETNGS